MLDIYVISDDTDMLDLADVFNIKTMKTQELLHLMLECEHVDIDKIRQIAAYWEYISDKPANFRQDYRRRRGTYPHDQSQWHGLLAGLFSPLRKLRR